MSLVFIYHASFCFKIPPDYLNLFSTTNLGYKMWQGLKKTHTNTLGAYSKYMCFIACNQRSALRNVPYKSFSTSSTLNPWGWHVVCMFGLVVLTVMRLQCCVCVWFYVHTHVIELCLVSTQRVLVQATGSAQKGGVQQHSVPRVQQVPQQVHSTIHTCTVLWTHLHTPWKLK